MQQILAGNQIYIGRCYEHAMKIANTVVEMFEKTYMGHFIVKMENKYYKCGEFNLR